jgi:hypothetical protein
MFSIFFCNKQKALLYSKGHVKKNRLCRADFYLKQRKILKCISFMKLMIYQFIETVLELKIIIMIMYYKHHTINLNW